MVLGSLILVSILPIQQNQPTPPTEVEIQEAMAYGMKIAKWQDLPMTSFHNRDRVYFSNYPKRWTIHFSNGRLEIDDKSRKVSVVSFRGLSVKRLPSPVSMEAARDHIVKLTRLLFPGKSFFVSQGSTGGEPPKYFFGVNYLHHNFQVVGRFCGRVTYESRSGFIQEIEMPTEPSAFGDATIGISMDQAKSIALAKARLRKPGDYFFPNDPGLYFKEIDNEEILSMIFADWRTQQDILDAENNKALLVYDVSIARRPDENGRGAAKLFYVIEAKTGRVLYETK